MTREEAIKIIDCYDIGFYDLSGEKIPADKLAEAFDMAIEALSQPIVAKHFDIQSGYIYCSPQIAENVKVVVRCKDCKWHMNDYMGEWCGRLSGVRFTNADDFCSHGERKEPLPQYEEWQDEFNKMCESARPSGADMRGEEE